MDIQILKEFISLYETCSFQETSEEMNLSQSALTKHIHKLEEELGISLFDRSTRSVTLNEYGKTYYPYAKQIVQIHDSSIMSLKSLTKKRGNTLCVAFAPSLSHYGMIEMLNAFREAHPECILSTVETPDALKLLRQYKCDFAFTPEASEEDDTVNQLIFQSDHLVAVLPPSHPMANQQMIMLKDIQEENFILHQYPSGGLHTSSRRFMELCRKNGFEPHIAAKTSYTSSIVKMVRLGQGVSIVFERELPAEAKDMAILELIPAVESHTYFFYHIDRKPPQSVSAFLRFLTSYERPEA